MFEKNSLCKFTYIYKYVCVCVIFKVVYFFAFHVMEIEFQLVNFREFSFIFFGDNSLNLVLRVNVDDIPYMKHLDRLGA